MLHLLRKSKNKKVLLALVLGLFAIGLIKFLPDFFSSNESLVVNIYTPDNYTESVVLARSDISLSLRPVAAQAAVKQTIEPYKDKYVDAYPNTDIIQTKSPSKLKEDIVLKKPGHPDKFVYKLGLGELQWEKDNSGNFIFYEKTNESNLASKRLSKAFTIPAPFLIDADGVESDSEMVKTTIVGDELILEPNKEWLMSHPYPIILDPTVEISILNLHSHPQQGENWEVEFTTSGTADLTITPADQATIDDDVFTGLYCGTQERQPQILPGDVIFYPDWQCDQVAKVVHYTLTAGKHHLVFEFGDQIAHAYNSTIVETGNNTNSAATGSTASITHGLTINADDVIIIIVHADGNTGSQGFTDNNSPFTFTEAIQENSAADSTYAIYYRVAGSSEPSSYSFTMDSSDDWAIQIRVFSGVDTASVWDVAPSVSTRATVGAGTTVNAPSMTTSNDGAMGIVVGLTDSAETFAGANNSYGTEVEDLGGNRGTASYIRTWTTAGSTGATTITMDGSNDVMGHQFALKPSAAVNVAPTITSIADTPDPTNPDRSVTFVVDWDDTNDMIKAKVCKTNSLTSQNCDGGFWASSSTFTTKDPEELMYDVLEADHGQTRNYYVFVCDDEAECTSSSSGSFSVNYQSTVPNIKFR